MNKQEFDLLITLKKSTFVNQRALAKDSGYSLGLVNSALKNLVEAGYLTADYALSKKALALFEANTPKRAVILAAGSGIRIFGFFRESSSQIALAPALETTKSARAKKSFNSVFTYSKNSIVCERRKR